MFAMRSVLSLLLLAGTSSALTTRVTPRAATACFVVGNTALPAEVQDSVTSIQNLITCSANVKTLSGVPDVTAGDVSFSDVNFAASKQSPLAFALSEFATSAPLAKNDLQLFQDRLDVYLATEAGIRSVDGNLAIKVPKFFLEFQVSRINTAQGHASTDPAQDVNHLRDKVLKNAAGESQDLLDQVTKLATVLS